MGLAIAYTNILALPVFIINIDRLPTPDSRLPTPDYPVEILAVPGDIIDVSRESMA